MVRYRIVRKAKNGKAYPKAWKYYETISDISRSLTASCRTYGIGTEPFDICGIDIQTYTLDESRQATWEYLPLTTAKLCLSKQAAWFIGEVFFSGGYNKE